MARRFITEREWDAWRLWYVKGWKLGRIARHLGVTESAISQRLSRVEKRLGSRFCPPRQMRRQQSYIMSLSDVKNV